MAFDLSSIQRGKSIKAPRIFLYATHGIGKSTFASAAPNPIFICTEDGLGSIDTASFPLAASSADVLGALETLYTQDHDFQTVVLDSADWYEQILQREIEATHEAKELAYGKGAVILADKWKQLLDGLNALRNDKGMAIIMIGHCEIKRFDSPEVDSYDRYQPKLAARSSALLQEWADAVLFANYKTVVRKEDVGFNKSVSKGITTGERVLHTAETPAYLAKNRYSLPSQLPLDWAAFSAAMTVAAQ
jgi:hypothetical protein